MRCVLGPSRSRLLALLLLIAAVCIWLEPIRANEEKTYGVILDCGSSGTRVHIYQWDTKLDYPELLQKIEPLRDEDGKEVSKKFKPRLADLARRGTVEREEHFAELMDYVAKNIPRPRHAFTVIYMMATAGMRLLDESDQDEIIDQVREYVYKNYDFREVKPSVIPGAKEGMYRWISVNAKAKRFLGEKTDGRTKTYAVIEMGGASVQVVYQLRPGLSQLFQQSLKASKGHKLAKIYKKQIVEPKISRKNDPDHRYQLHSTTFLGFGADSAHNAFLDLLIWKQHNRAAVRRFLQTSAIKAKRWWTKITHWANGCSGGFGCAAPQSPPSNKPKLIIEDPCAPRGFHSPSPELDPNKAIKKPTRMLNNKDQTIGFIVDDEDEKAGKVFWLQVVGTGDYNKCKRYVEDMLWLARSERLNCKQDELCTMELLGNQFIPWESTDFVGIGDFYHTSSIMLELAGFYKHDQIADKTKEICNTSERRLKELYPTVANGNFPDRIYTECFRAVWMDTFLVRGLRMDPDFDSLVTMDKIDGQDPDWTLGAVLDESIEIEEATEIPLEVLEDD